jgi:FtsP/CotA-like multicopper oxidase with cupredoxin domain
MRTTKMKKAISKTRLLLAAMVAVTLLLAATAAYAAAPGITGPTFNLTAQPAYITQPDGAMVYSWGYGCNGTPSGFLPAAIASHSCSSMQVPGPTLIVTEGQTVTVNLTNNLPTSAGNTSILFPGFNVSSNVAVAIGIVSISETGTTVTVTTSTPHNLATGGSVIISGVTPAGYNGTFVVTVVDTTNFTYTAAAGLPTGLGGTAVASGVTGLLTQEAAPGGTVTYTFTASSPGTRAYYSGTQGDLQVEMGLYGAIIVLPSQASTFSNCNSSVTNLYGQTTAGPTQESDFRLAVAAYDHAKTCYDREYLFQFSEMDQNIHAQALAQVSARSGCTAGAPGCSLEVPTEPYHPTYFLINGRSMPDDMDSNYAPEYPHQPYNGNPHMHPGEQVLLRIIGQGRWQHPFHEHGNHVRILGRDGNLILSQSDASQLAGPLLFTTTTTPGLAMDGIFYFTGRGLNWDMYGHNGADPVNLTSHPACVPDANGYYTLTSGAPYTAINYFEWCQDHLKPVQVAPFGDVAGGGPVSLPDANVFTNGAWYGGSPYLGPDAAVRAVGPTGSTPPSGTIANNPTTEAGFAFMWHSHNEREITTDNAFPGGMLMMMLVDSREFVIDESN